MQSPDDVNSYFVFFSSQKDAAAAGQCIVFNEVHLDCSSTGLHCCAMPERTSGSVSETPASDTRADVPHALHMLQETIEQSPLLSR